MKEKALFQIKRDLINDHLRSRMPNFVNAKQPLEWWLDQEMATVDELEAVDLEDRYENLKKQLARFQNDFENEKMKLLFSIGYKLGYDDREEEDLKNKV